jgi:hypothetical protein
MSLENEPGVDLEKLRSIGFLSRGRTRSRSTSGREHPESGLPYKTVTDELGNEVTEHGSSPGSGVSGRQDVNIAAEHVTGFGSAHDG